MRTYKKKTLIIFFIFGFLLIILSYYNHFNNAFQFDDEHTIVNNLFIRDLKNIPEIFTNPNSFSSLPGKQARPLTTVSFAIDYWLDGGLKSTFYFHLTTFICHLILIFLLYLFYKNILDLAYLHEWNEYIALYASILFGLHTANAETVNYICQRADILSTLTVVAGLVIYAYCLKCRKYGIYLLPVIAGLMMKESTTMFAPLLVFYIMFFEKKITFKEAFKVNNFLSVIRSALPALIICFIAAILILKFTISSRSTGNISWLNYLMTQPFVILHYFLTFFLPFNLSADTDWTAITNIFDDRLIVGIIFIVIMISTAYKKSKAQKYLPISFGIIWFFVALLPTSSFFPFAEVMNDHRMFFPFVGLTISVCWWSGLFLLKHQEKLKKNNLLKTTIIIISISILIAHAYGTHNRNKVWHTAESLWYDVTIKSPHNGRGLMNYGITQMEKGNYNRALTYFERALEFTPYYSYLHINLGVLKAAMNQHEEAEKYFKNALSYDPNNPEAYYFYARWLRDRGRYDEAIIFLEKLIKISPAHTYAPALLNEIKTNQNKPLSFIENAEKLAKTYPSPENYLNLSLQYHRAGKYLASINACKEALKLKPDYDLAYNNICAAYNDMGEWDKAIEACKKGLKINPDNQLLKNNLNRSIIEKSKQHIK